MSNHIRRIESDPIAAANHANMVLKAIREGKISGDRELLRQSLYNLAATIEPMDPHLAATLELTAEEL